MESSSLSIIKINQQNLKANLSAFKRILPPAAKLMPVVKANAYGHGMEQIVPAIENDVYGFQIDDLDEFLQIREITDKRVLILGFTEPSKLRLFLDKCSNCKPVNTDDDMNIMAVLSIEQLIDLNSEAKKLAVVIPVHVAIDTTFGREGVLFSEDSELFNALSLCKNLKVLGFYSHFSRADELSSEHSALQVKIFDEFISKAKQHGYESADFHIQGSGGMLRYLSSHFNLRAETEREIFSRVLPKLTAFRLGISLYGHYPSSEMEENVSVVIKPVMQWETKIAQIKEIPAGFDVGYGGTHRTKNLTRLALLPIGYSDGYPRALSDKAEVLIQGQRCRIVGRISMNMCVADCSQVENPVIGESVVLIGQQGNETVTSEELAEKAGTIQYEILARIRNCFCGSHK